jgi:DNA repair exonuclease SbcCD ATPase subunit
MVSQDTGQEHLDIYDKLDMEEREERRLKAYTMVDYYCRVISEVSTEYLGLKGDIRTDSLKEQWEQCRTRLQALDDFSVPNDYSKAIYWLHSIRNDVAHDYQKNPSESEVEHIHDVAADWRSWLIEKAEEYDEVKGELDARKTMIRIAQRSLDEIEDIDVPHHEPFASDVRSAKERAEDISDKLDGLKSGDDISIELVYALLDAKELTQQVNESREGDAHVDWALSEVAEPEVSPEEVGLK